MCEASYLNMQHLGAGARLFLHSEWSFRRIPALLQPRSITARLKGSKFLNSIGNRKRFTGPNWPKT